MCTRSDATPHSEHASRIILPLSRLLRTADPETRNDVMQCMCGLVYQLRSDFAIFIPIVGKAIDSYEEEVGLEIPQPYFMQVRSAKLVCDRQCLYSPRHALICLLTSHILIT